MQNTGKHNLVFDNSVWSTMIMVDRAQSHKVWLKLRMQSRTFHVPMLLHEILFDFTRT